MPNKDIWVAGYPSRYGGADTELDHLIDLWLRSGLGVNLVPFGEPNKEMKASCTSRGCRTWDFRPDIFKDKVVISLCNSAFLAKLPEICAVGRPRATLWANCMTWTFPKEIQAHKDGLIDYHLYQSEFQKNMIVPTLSKDRAVNILEGYRPYFNMDRFATPRDKPNNYIGYGRISRDDGDKFHKDTWKIFTKICTPQPKKVFILGYGPNAHSKCGSIPLDPNCGWLDWQVWQPGAIPAEEFFQKIHALVHYTGGSRENWPRAVLEAWGSGTVPIVENDYGVKEMISNLLDGFTVSCPDHAAYCASMLAFDPALRMNMIQAGYDTLQREHSNLNRSMEPFWRVLNAV